MNIRESVVHTLRCESEIIAELEKTVSEEQIEKFSAQQCPMFHRLRNIGHCCAEN